MSLPSQSLPYLKSSGSQTKYSVAGKGEASQQFSKMVKRMTLGATNPSTSSLCLVKSWSRSSWKMCQNICKTGR